MPVVFRHANGLSRSAGRQSQKFGQLSRRGINLTKRAMGIFAVDEHRSDDAFVL